MAIDYPLSSILVGAALAFAGATAVAGAAVRAGFPVPAGDRRIGCIDGLRGYLALSVLVHHFVVWMQVTRLGGTWSPPGVALLNNLGAGGVALFFMTTGLVFYPRILAGFLATSWTTVAITRASRIVPLVAVSVALVAAIIVLRTGARPAVGDLRAAVDWITARAQPPLLGDPEAGRIDAFVLWSLRYEWIFYIAVLPACALAMDLGRGRVPSWAVPVALLCAALAARRLHGFWELPKYVPLFALGMLAHEAQRSAAVRVLLRHPAASVLAAISLVLGLSTADEPYGMLQMGLLAFFFSAVAAGNSLGGALRTRAALALGECSYGIYLLHGVALSLLFVEGAGLLGGIPTDGLPLVTPVVAMVVAALTPFTFLAVERPMMRMGVRIARALTRRRVYIMNPQVEVAP